MKKTQIKKIASYAITAVLAIVLLVNTITAFLSITEQRRELGWLPYAVLCVQGSSMEPRLSEGDLIIIREVPYDELAVGDDITFWGTDGFVTHRIVGTRNGAYTTRGIANETDDFYTVGEASYCGKVIGAIPLLGYVQVFVSGSYWVLLLGALALAVLFFARPFWMWLKGREKAPEKPRFAMARRLVAFGGVVSMLLSIPFVTEAKYTGQINTFELGVAQSVYLTSNYLSEGAGNTYSIQGWKGTEYTLNLNMRNYENALLYNKSDVSVTFGFGVRIKSGNGLSTDYTIRIEPVVSHETPDTGDSGNTPEPEAPTTPTPPEVTFAYPDHWGEDKEIKPCGFYTIQGNDAAAQTISFALIITPKTANLAADTEIEFEVYAVTDAHETYEITLGGTFRFRVAGEVKFIGIKEEKAQSSMIDLTVKTNNVNEGNDEKIVVFKWDPAVLYINEFESTAFNIIHIHKELGKYDATQGLLYIKMQAYSSINLEFFKKTPFTSNGNAIVVEVVESMTDLPLGTPQYTLPVDPDASVDPDEGRGGAGEDPNGSDDNEGGAV